MHDDDDDVEEDEEEEEVYFESQRQQWLRNNSASKERDIFCGHFFCTDSLPGHTGTLPEQIGDMVVK